MEQAQAEYPILRGLGLGYKYNPGGGSGYLEFWPGDESGTPERPRPSEFPLGKAGVEVYDPTTRPIDIMGDVASHHLIYQDSTVAQTYQQFEQSLTAKQKQQLQKQYQHAQEHEGEQRPYDAWYQHSGLPGYFRGYAFQQWPNANELYTKDQLKLFDDLMQYLRSAPKQRTP